MAALINSILIRQQNCHLIIIARNEKYENKQKQQNQAAKVCMIYRSTHYTISKQDHIKKKVN